MTDVITTPKAKRQPLLCEGKHLYKRPVALYYGMRSRGEGTQPTGLCGTHANSDKRWYGKVERMTPEVEAVIRERLAATKARQDAEQAATRTAEEQRHAARVAKAWAEVPAPYEMHLSIEDSRWEGGAPAIAVIVRPVGGSDDAWDHVQVILQCGGPGEPTYARIRAGSPSDLTPSAASVLADAVALVGVWAQQANEA